MYSVFPIHVSTISCARLFVFQLFFSALFFQELNHLSRSLAYIDVPGLKYLPLLDRIPPRSAKGAERLW